jgi:hypothetical protein
MCEYCGCQALTAIDELTLRAADWDAVRARVVRGS